MREPILVTGAAGFIGFHLARRLVADGWTVHGLDNLNDYYDPRLKEARLGELRASANFRFEKCDLADRSAVAALFAKQRFSYVAHLAAQAGVAHSAVDPPPMSMQPGRRQYPRAAAGECRHLLYASSSSVYGTTSACRCAYSTGSTATEALQCDQSANELMAYTYAHMFGLPATGLRFFTVYGPWGRPDMAVWLFTQAIFEDRPVRLYNHGHMRRDFTYVDDVIEAVVRLIEAPPETAAAAAPTSQPPPHRLYNVGNAQPVEVTALLDILEKVIGKPARRELLPMRPIDVLETFADSSELQRATGFAPRTPIEDGLRAFVTWYRDYRGNK